MKFGKGGRALTVRFHDPEIAVIFGKVNVIVKFQYKSDGPYSINQGAGKFVARMRRVRISKCLSSAHRVLWHVTG